MKKQIPLSPSPNFLACHVPVFFEAFTLTTNIPLQVTHHTGPEQLADALKGAHVVVIPAGVPRKPGD